MPHVLGRESELAVIDRFFESVCHGPVGLCLAGEAGIGKSTLLQSAVVEAGTRGFVVLRCQPSGAEVQMSYAALTDLLEPCSEVHRTLPEPQRQALDAAMLRGTVGDRGPELRTVAAGTLSVLDRLAASSPVLVAIDDTQWLDDPSLRAITFAVRRCHGNIGVLWTVRDSDGSIPPALVPRDPSRTHTLAVPGLRVGPLVELVRSRLGRSVERTAMQGIVRVSQGNPLFALEMARTLTPGAAATFRVPSHLAQTLLERFDGLPQGTREALLVCSAVAVPTLDVLHRARLPDAEPALAPAEAANIVRWDGSRLQFVHPMWREVIYARASAPQRRTIHRLVSEAVHDVEERARHRALGMITPDVRTVRMLDDAADHARARGAPSAAADLLEVALALGITDPVLRLRAAQHHLAADETERALELARSVADEGDGRQAASARALAGAITFQIEDFAAAIPQLVQAYDGAAGEPALRAEVSIDLAFALANTGQNAQGLVWAGRAVGEAEEVGDVGLIAESAGAAAVLAFLNGEPFPAGELEGLLALEDRNRATPVVRWVSVSAALICLWSRDLPRARALFEQIRSRCLEQGMENGLWLVLARAAEAAMWSGDVAAAHELVADLMDRSVLVPGGSVDAYGRAAEVSFAAWTGRVDQARAAHSAFLQSAGSRHGLAVLVAMAALGMAELSIGDTAGAHEHLAPVAAVVAALGMGDPVITAFFPDAIETMVARGEPEQAEPLVAVLEQSGARSTRRWPTGAARRGRGVMAAGRGDLDEAEQELISAAGIFDAPGFEYERARTLLLLGKLHRRRRARARARDALTEAAALFDRVATTRWAANAREELRHLGLTHDRADGQLTPSEERVAELAAAGLTNVAVAARLSISPKTVEANLSRIYRKLGITSRAQLGTWFAGRQSPTNHVSR